MFIGYAQNIITPSLERPVFLAGFDQNRRATAIHDDLYVRALTICTPEQTLVLCALDLIGFFRPHIKEIIQRVGDHYSEPNKPAILIASLHPHDGPDTMGLWGPDNHTSGVDPFYLAELKDKAVATILSALATTRESPAMKSVCLRVPGLAKNARNPEILDDELTALQFLDASGRPLASLFDFPCHPEVMWEHNTQVSADYVGYLRQGVEEATGGTPCIFFSGALGGMMTPDVKEHSFAEAEAIGQSLAKAGLEALGNASGLPVTEISVQKKEIKVKLTNILYKFAFRRKLLPDVRDRLGCIASEVGLIKVGPAWFATIPGELLPKLGLALKADMKAAGAHVAGVICLANDELGYILPAEDFRFPLNPFKPGKHYEETNSISKEIGPAVLDAVRSLF